LGPQKRVMSIMPREEDHKARVAEAITVEILVVAVTETEVHTVLPNAEATLQTQILPKEHSYTLARHLSSF